MFNYFTCVYKIMREAEDVIEDAKSAARDLYHLLQTDGVTGAEVKDAAAVFDDIEYEIEEILKDG